MLACLLPMQLYGGNPCINASDTYNCSICKFEGECKWNSGAGAHTCPGAQGAPEGSWDFSQAPGFYALWSAAGRSDYVVSGPHDVTHDGLYDKGEHARAIDAPASLAIQPGEHPVVAFFVSAAGRQHRNPTAPSPCPEPEVTCADCLPTFESRPGGRPTPSTRRLERHRATAVQSAQSSGVMRLSLIHI